MKGLGEFLETNPQSAIRNPQFPRVRLQKAVSQNRELGGAELCR